MEINVGIIIEIYKEELAKLQNENIILKAQVLQLQKDLEEMRKQEVVSGDDE